MTARTCLAAAAVTWCIAAVHARPCSMQCAFVFPPNDVRHCSLVSTTSTTRFYGRKEEEDAGSSTRPRMALWRHGLAASLDPRRLFGKERQEKQMMDEDDHVTATTMKWIRKNVIGLNLCPFAERPIQTKELTTRVVWGDDHEEIAKAVAMEMLNKRDQVGTVLVICPEYFFDDFERYLSMVQYLEQHTMEYLELHEDVQIAPFHPLLVFEGTDEDSVENFVNRSPYPMFHILRKDDVNRATAKLNGDIGKVWRRNKLLLQNLQKELGTEKVVDIMTGGGDSYNNEETIQTVIEKTGMEMAEEERKGGGEKLTRHGWIR